MTSSHERAPALLLITCCRWGRRAARLCVGEVPQGMLKFEWLFMC